MNKKQLIIEVNDLLETYCGGCFLQEHYRKTQSKYYAHSFCIRQCTVGAKLKEYGNQLS
ncbi:MULTISPECIES: zinc-finger domain-containing protein [Bacillus]|uniref:Zinc-finger domain-containing protein n=1 Tax=Bacillus pseudomycoides TaxID=64104 RepID=A0A1Y3MF54_9BACI|nr:MULTISPECIES: zinc-finger domain-containing protein [Bacillus cereus group]OUM48686.1 zinc-finger domain-containing protein [Bacillus pseudomycoides]